MMLLFFFSLHYARFVIPVVCPILSFLRFHLIVISEVCWSEIQYTSCGNAPTWIPEYYLGDDETKAVFPVACPISSFPRSFGRESSLFVAWPPGLPAACC